jgi:hypothetical protein
MNSGTIDQPKPASRLTLFDSDGLPWTSRLDWGWLLLLFLVTGPVFPILLGIYLGLWLKTKHQSSASLLIYLAVPLLSIADWILDLFAHSASLAEACGFAALILWIVGAFVLRHQVSGYFTDLEGEKFPLDLLKTFVFSVFYIGGCIRADFPLNEAGKAPPGVLKLAH